MIGVTIGTGKFKDLAEMAAERFRKYTRLDCVVLGDDHQRDAGLAYPHHLKYHMFDLIKDHDELVYFDADIMYMGNWSPEHIREKSGDALVVVRDLFPAGHIVGDARQFELNPFDYFNSGFMMLNRDKHLTLLRMASSVYDKIISSERYSGKSKFKDQTSLNIAAQWGEYPIRYLPRTYNCVQSASKWMEQGYPVVAAHKPSRTLPKETRTDHERWLEFFKGPVPVPMYETSLAAHQVMEGIYELKYENEPSKRMVLHTDGSIEGGGYHESWWMPVRREPQNAGNFDMHVMGVPHNPKKRCQELFTFIGTPVEGGYNEWDGTTRLDDPKNFKLRKLT